MIKRLLLRPLWPALVLALVGALAPTPASASLPSWSDARVLDGQLRGETAPLADVEIETAAPHVHGAFCPDALSQPKTRVRGFDLRLGCLVGGAAGLTCTSRPAYGLRYGGSAVEQSVFTGYEFDKETGLYNAKARYFDPQLGRFLTQDSYLGEIDNPPSLHRYFYGYANPLQYVDPDGHQTIGAEYCRAYNCDSSVRHQVDPLARATDAIDEVVDTVEDKASFALATGVTYAWNATLGSPGHNAGPEAFAPYPEPKDDAEALLGALAILAVDVSPALVPAGRRLAGRPRPAPGELTPAGPRTPQVVAPKSGLSLGQKTAFLEESAKGATPVADAAVPAAGPPPQAGAPGTGVARPRHGDFEGPWREQPGDAFNWKRYLEKETGTKPPSEMPDAHAHHILAKRGRPSQRALIEEGQEILRRRGGIDPVFGTPNLTWAPNRIPGQHSTATIRGIVENLRTLDDANAPPEAFTSALDEAGKAAAQRR